MSLIPAVVDSETNLNVHTDMITSSSSPEEVVQDNLYENCFADSLDDDIGHDIAYTNVGSLVEMMVSNGVQICLLDSLSESVYPFAETNDCKEPELPKELQDYEDIFDLASADRVPPHRHYDCKIDLIENHSVPVGKSYQLTMEEDKVLKEWIEDNLDKGFIRRSSSEFASPCFFVKKASWKNDSKLRLCIDYRLLNSMTLKCRYPLPLISDIIRTLSKGKIYSCLDLANAYNLLRIRPGDEHKTAFITKHGQFEFVVMPFGLTNAPGQFQKMMDTIFKDHLGKIVLIYLDDIIVFSDSLEQHWKDLRTVLEILRNNQLFCKLKKCNFAVEKLNFLGYTISSNGVQMDDRKIQAVREWPTPRNVKHLQMFLGFVNFYR
ncbi:hypothetical protein MP638_002840, partial [Amoeboaphelidium occidentale]